MSCTTSPLSRESDASGGKKIKMSMSVDRSVANSPTASPPRQELMITATKKSDEISGGTNGDMSMVIMKVTPTVQTAIQYFRILPIPLRATASDFCSCNI